MSRSPIRASALLLTAMLITGLLATPARADVPGPITDRVIDIIDDAGGTVGMYVKEVGGSVIAAENETFAFEPASTVKVIPHLYAHIQVQDGNAAFTDQVTLYEALGCPANAMVLGTEDLSSSLGKMMRVSDNPATRAQFELWGLMTLNDFTATLGANQTDLQNIIGCQVPNSPTVDDNTTSLTDLGIFYEGVADSSLISGTIRQSFFDLMSGREQFEDFGFDFTGIWPKLVAMVDAEAPPGMPTALKDDFKALMTANHKGGGYGKCLNNGCTSLEQWLSFAGWAEFPTCENQTFGSQSYVWGIFIHGAIDNNNQPNNMAYVTPAGMALGNGAAEPLREQMEAALAGWGACYPPDVTVSTTPATVPAGQAGYFNAADLAANGGAIDVNVSATDDSGVTDLLCTDNGNAVAVSGQMGNDPRTGSFGLVSDGTHDIECEATDGMTPANTGASANSMNTATVMIDATAPTVICDATPTFVLNGPGGEVTATVSDATSGPVDGSVDAPVDTSVAGAHTAVVTGMDNAGNSTTVDCPYIVSYKFGGFLSPLPQAKAQAGSSIPVKFRLTDFNDVPIPDTEAGALAAACDVQIFFTAGDPVPNCVDYKSGPNRFEFSLKTPKSASGDHAITIKVFDGAVVINEHSTTVKLT